MTMRTKVLFINAGSRHGSAQQGYSSATVSFVVGVECARRLGEGSLYDRPYRLWPWLAQRTNTSGQWFTEHSLSSQLLVVLLHANWSSRQNTKRRIDRSRRKRGSTKNLPLLYESSDLSLNA
jgi:hypothetical protein